MHYHFVSTCFYFNLNSATILFTVHQNMNITKENYGYAKCCYCTQHSTCILHRALKTTAKSIVYLPMITYTIRIHEV